MSNAEILARATGAVSATHTVERRNADGSLTFVDNETWERPTSTRYITVATRDAKQTLEAYLYSHTRIVREKSLSTDAFGSLRNYFVLETESTTPEYHANYQQGRLNSGWGFAATVHDTEDDALAWLFDTFGADLHD